MDFGTVGITNLPAARFISSKVGTGEKRLLAQHGSSFAGRCAISIRIPDSLMNQAHIHLIVNHVPIAGSLFALLLLGAGLLPRNATLTKAGLVAVLAAGLLCLPAQLTGEGAAKVVQNLPRVSRALIQGHEAAAEQGFWAAQGAAALALLGLLLLRHHSPRARLVAGLALLATALSFGLLARAGSLGGQIVHTEIREGFGTPDEL